MTVHWSDKAYDILFEHYELGLLTKEQFEQEVRDLREEVSEESGNDR